MASKPQTRAQIIDAAENLLQDSSNATWTAAELGLYLDDVLPEASLLIPYVSRDIYTIESRKGLSTSTSANNLVDATNAHFASTDTGKVVYNSTDKTWAVITSYSSTSQVGLSKDIFTVGESYQIYNKGCWNSRQINIENSSDFLWIIGAQYPILSDSGLFTPQTLRNINLYNENKIAEIDAFYLDDSGDTSAYKDVAIYFARQHKLNVMTDLAGAVNNASGYVAGDTSMIVTSFGATETIYKDSLFTVALASGISSRLTYRVTADVTMSGGGGTVAFWPGLEATVANSAVVTFVGSTIPPAIEPMIVDMIVGKALMSEGISKINVFSRGGTGTPNRYYDMGERIYEKAYKKLKALMDIDLRANYYARSRS